MSAVKDFITQQLAATGWAPYHYAAAMRLRPDKWAIGLDCRYEFARSNAKPELPGVESYMVNVESIGLVEVLARCPDNLAERMHLVLGLNVTMHEGAKPEEPARIVTMEPEQIRYAKARIEKLRALAMQEPPAHICSLRSDILAARAELERMPAEDAKTEDNEAPVANTVVSNPVSTTTQEPHEPAGTLERAKSLLSETLKVGARPAGEVLDAAAGAGISERTMQRAADALGVVKTKGGFGSGWMWAMQ
ncbi:MAG: hypothetical protein PHD37_00955 [Gallionellaceae bacterium]|nr:hypothetical protein [Gallionellaceae bacterium]